MSTVVPDEGGRLRPTAIRVNLRSFAVPLYVGASDRSRHQTLDPAVWIFAEGSEILQWLENLRSIFPIIGRFAAARNPSRLFWRALRRQRRLP